MPTREQLIGELFYLRYLKSSGGKAWDGKPCPTWVELNKAVRGHWIAVATDASAIISDVESHISGTRCPCGEAPFDLAVSVLCPVCRGALIRAIDAADPASEAKV